VNAAAAVALAGGGTQDRASPDGYIRQEVSAQANQDECGANGKKE